MFQYDPAKPELLPLALSAHVIVDVRTGVTYKKSRAEAWQAMGSSLSEMLGRDEFEKLDAKDEVFKFAMSAARAMLGRSVDPDLQHFLDSPVLKVGPFITWNEHLHNKNVEFLTQRVERLVEGGEPEQADRDLATKMRKDIISQRAEYEAEAALNKKAGPDSLGEILAQFFGEGTKF